MNQHSMVVSALGLLVALSGCASDPAGESRGSESLSEIRDREIESERRERIQESRERLEEVERDIAQLELRLEHEGRQVDDDQRAAWSDALFELRQRHSQVAGQLARAETASPEQWRRMRGRNGVTLDSLEASLIRAGDALSAAFGTEETTGRDRPRLCALRGHDATDVNVRRAGGRVVVEMTTRSPEAVGQLQTRARDLSRQPGTRSPATRAAVEVREIERGVELVFAVPAGRARALHEELRLEARRVQSGDC
jgi:hypothetical protein